MPRAISSGLQSDYAAGTTRFVSCWRATLTDGTVVRAALHSDDIEFPVGSGEIYLAAQGFDPSNVESSGDLSVDNLEVQGFLASPSITADDIHNGRWDYAEIELFEINLDNLAHGKNIIRKGTLGQVQAGRSIFTAGLRGLTQKYSRKIVTLTKQECDANLGDSRCKIDLAPWTVTGSVAHVDTNKVITDASRTEPTDWFTGGLLTFTSGLNNGRSMEVKSYTKITGGGLFELFEQMPAPIYAADTPIPPAPGPSGTPSSSTPDTFSVYAGCQKRFYQDCIGKFNNAINFRGFPHLPGVGIFGPPGTNLTPATVPTSASAPPPGSPPPPAPAPSPTPAPAPQVASSVGVNLHEGGGSTGANTTIAGILAARHFTRNRVDIFGAGHDLTLVRDMVSRIKANGGTAQGVMQTSYQWDSTIYTDLAAVEAASYSEMTSLVNAVKDLITDFELLNETQLRPEINAAVPVGSAGTSSGPYTGIAACESLAAILKGMARAVHDLATADGKPYRVIMGVVNRDFGWLTYLASRGVTWDVTGWHVYPSLASPSLLTDTYYGTGGPLTQLASFGKPITINEFNAGEIYDAGYENADGATLTEEGYQSVAQHMGEIRQSSANIESVIAYELLDEPGAGVPENRFGLMFNTSSPKVALYLWTYFAGGTLSSTEMTALTSRGLVTATTPVGSKITGYAPGVITPSDTAANFTAFIRQQYDYWSGPNGLLKSTNTGIGSIPAGGYWVQFSDPTYATVSEGMGYGLLITVLMAGYDANAQAKFDGLLKTVLAFPAGNYGGLFNMTNLMTWRVAANGTDAGGAWPATDGDLDIVLALLMADVQWGSGGTYNYKSIALGMLAQIKSYAFTSSGVIVENSGVTHEGRTSDYMFGHFRAFKRATGDAFWDSAISEQKRIVDYVQRNLAPATGLLPDWVGGADTANPFLTTSVNDGGNPHEDGYWYNACRDPWRFGTDYALTGDADIKTYLTRMEQFFVRATGGVVTNICNGYSLTGAPLNANNPYWIDEAFYCPMMVGATCDPLFQGWLDALWSFAKAHPAQGYYSTEIQLISAIVVSGNWWTP
jgi:uncharacterized phage protein (TIGR02218 family)